MLNSSKELAENTERQGKGQRKREKERQTEKKKERERERERERESVTSSTQQRNLFGFKRCVEKTDNRTSLSPSQQILSSN